MFEFVTPHGLFRTQIHTLRETLPGVRGDSRAEKAQDLLGDLHDRQELIDNLIETCPPDQPEAASQVSLLKQVIEAENRDLHARYLVRRAATFGDRPPDRWLRRVRSPSHRAFTRNSGKVR
jgi:hypothetical protein